MTAFSQQSSLLWERASLRAWKGSGLLTVETVSWEHIQMKQCGVWRSVSAPKCRIAHLLWPQEVFNSLHSAAQWENQYAFVAWSLKQLFFLFVATQELLCASFYGHFWRCYLFAITWLFLQSVSTFMPIRVAVEEWRREMHDIWELLSNCALCSLQCPTPGRWNRMHYSCLQGAGFEVSVCIMKAERIRIAMLYNSLALFHPLCLFLLLVLFGSPFCHSFFVF